MNSPAPDAPVALTVDGLTAGYGGPPVIENVSIRARSGAITAIVGPNGAGKSTLLKAIEGFISAGTTVMVVEHNLPFIERVTDHVVVSIRARSGAITAIVGPNGAGKSTLLKAIAGLIRPTAGRVIVEGIDVTGQPAERLVRKGLAYVPQVANVFPDLTIRENLEMGGYSRKAGVAARIEQLFRLFPDLKGSAQRQAHTLSGGQRTMLALARGLMVDPAVLILDEPSAGLAPRFQGAIWDRIEEIRETNVAVVVIEQNTRETLRHAQWAYVLVLGQNRLEGAGHDLLNDDEVVNLYVGRLS
jgi:branched-chain amino acid transport system ATP-binding protein